ncbi:MAG: CaiB/BaiF CoA transferase family protein [Flavobacteriaceae bacterium]
MRAVGNTAGSPLRSFLQGVRVLDLSQYIPGPMTTLFLTDMGADVLKIEPPQGDEMRNLGPRGPDGRPVFYDAMNTGKQVRRMNLKDPGEHAQFLQLVDDADVVVEGFRPGVMNRLGIDYPVLSARNPGIVMCSISGYGVGTTLGAAAGHDANYMALMGALHRNGTDKPVFFDPPISDVAGSLFAALAIVGALHGRMRTGRGCEIDLALADTVMPLQMMQVADFGANGTVPGPRTTYLNGGAAYYQVYATGDGRHIVLGSLEPKFWEMFCRAAGRPDWIPRHADPFPQTALETEVASYFRTLTTEEALAKFGDVDCCFTLINDLGEALGEPHIAERQLVRGNSTGELQSLFPVWVDGVPPQPRENPKVEDQRDGIVDALDRRPGVARR